MSNKKLKPIIEFEKGDESLLPLTVEVLIEEFMKYKKLELDKIIDILVDYYEVDYDYFIDIVKNTKYSNLLDSVDKEEEITSKMRTILTCSAINKMLMKLSENNPNSDIISLVRELDSYLSIKSGKDSMKLIMRAINTALKEKGRFFSFYMREFKKLRPNSCHNYISSMCERDFCK